MNARTLLHTTIMLAALVSLEQLPTSALAADSTQSQYYELRVYSTKSEEQQRLVSDYWQNAAIPAYNRMDIHTIGLFTELQDSLTNKIYVLIPYDSLEVFAAIPARLAADTTYQAAAADYMARSKSNPAYERIESSLNVAFDGMKKLAVPSSLAEKKPWIFELRTYQSSSESKGINKVKMFNSGEIPLMQEVGLCPVFFAQTLVGSQMPNLVYMVSGENMGEHKKHWEGFFGAPVWKKLIGDPQYKGNVSRVISIFLKRQAGSQI
ncbi:MAG TPA: NIPSNAP family protein [Candidatus Saccharimonadales bacterium]|nr:NIPSNAP family protein [Candidatus Saccharimonadales bacterium]